MSRIIFIAALALSIASKSGARVTCAGFQHGQSSSRSMVDCYRRLPLGGRFPGIICAGIHPCFGSQGEHSTVSSGTALMYQRDPNEKDRDPSRNGLKVAWLALKKTEDWIKSRLEASSDLSNPYTRKEVTFECESSDNVAVIVANTFRRIREARELGELQQREETKQFFKKGKGYSPGTFRRTQVVVVPSCELMQDSFSMFDSVMRAVNLARSNVDDIVTAEDTEEWLTNSMKSSDESIKWDLRVNCAHMHPDFGKKTPQDILSEIEKQKNSGEKLNIEAMAQDMKQSEAKRSPYPTIVIEVHVTPTIEQKSASEDTREISNAVFQRLEAIFRLPAALDTPIAGEEGKMGENRVADKSTGNNKISSVKPMDRLAYEWIASNDPNYDESSSEITVAADAMSVDVGYEYVFSHIGIDLAMTEVERSMSSKRKYLLLPNFLAESATRFESFSREILRIVEAVGMSESLSVSILHPEHVSKEFRSPVPILLLKWFEGGARQ